MATEIKTWEILNDKMFLVNSTLSENQRKEREDLEKWIKTNQAILGDNIFIIGEQVQTKSGYLDFLGIDTSGNTVIVELKRDKLPREVITQAIDYASDVASWDVEKLSSICLNYRKVSLEDYMSDAFNDPNIEDLVINNSQRILVVGFGIDESTNRMIEYLSDNFNMGINAVVLSYSKTSAGSEIVSRTVIIPEEVEKSKANRGQFVIQMSDEIEDYPEDKLKELLKKYLLTPKHSSRRLKDYLLPALLKKKTMTRDQLRKEFVKGKEAKDESQAGYFIAILSKEFRYAMQGYLRQIIDYGYPDNLYGSFTIKDEYAELVKEVLEEIKTDAE